MYILNVFLFRNLLMKLIPQHKQTLRVPGKQKRENVIQSVKQ